MSSDPRTQHVAGAPGMENGRLTPEATRAIRHFLWKTVAVAGAIVAGGSAVGGYVLGSAVSGLALTKSLEVVTEAAQKVGLAQGIANESQRKFEAQLGEMARAANEAHTKLNAELTLVQDKVRTARELADKAVKSLSDTLANSSATGAQELRKILNDPIYRQSIAELLNNDMAKLERQLEELDAALRPIREHLPRVETYEVTEAYRQHNWAGRITVRSGYVPLVFGEHYTDFGQQSQGFAGGLRPINIYDDDNGKSWRVNVHGVRRYWVVRVRQS